MTYSKPGTSFRGPLRRGSPRAKGLPGAPNSDVSSLEGRCRGDSGIFRVSWFCLLTAVFRVGVTFVGLTVFFGRSLTICIQGYAAIFGFPFLFGRCVPCCIGVKGSWVL